MDYRTTGPKIRAILLCLIFLAGGNNRAACQSQDPENSPDMAGKPAPGQTAGEAEQKRPVVFRINGAIDNVVHFEELVTQDGDWLLNANRMSLGISGKTRKWLDFSARVVSKLYVGTTELYLPPYMPPDVRQTLLIPDPATGRLGVGPYLRNRLANDFYVQEAYGGLHAGSWYIRLGRQRFSSGTGYSYNPTDLFNRKNPIDPLYEVDGIDAISVELKRPRKGIRFLIRPSASRSPDYLFRVDGPVADWKLALQFTSIERPRTVWGALNSAAGLRFLDQGGAVSDFSEGSRWRQPAIEFTRAWGSLTFYGEAGFAFIDVATKTPAGFGTLEKEEKDHERLLLGIDRKFPSGLHMVFEYMRLGQGRPHDQALNLNDLMAYFTGEELSADKETVFFEISRPITNRVDAEVKVTGPLNHAGLFINPWVHFRLAKGLIFSLSGYTTFSVPEGQYANTGPGGFVQLRFDF